MQAAPTKSQHMDEATALAYRLVEIVSEQQTHQVALEALISAYASVAVFHPCCTQKAADLARRIAGVIESSAAPVGSHHIH